MNTDEKVASPVKQPEQEDAPSSEANKDNKEGEVNEAEEKEPEDKVCLSPLGYLFLYLLLYYLLNDWAPKTPLAIHQSISLFASYGSIHMPSNVIGLVCILVNLWYFSDFHLYLTANMLEHQL